MHHVQNKCIDSILFTNESHHEHARTLISRTCGTSPTQIDNWHVAPKKWHHKLKPKATNVTCVNTWRSGRDHHIRDLRRHLVRPFRHAIRDQDIRNVHGLRSRAACLSQEVAAETSRGAWARIRPISSTQTSPAKKTILCANINVRVAIRLRACLGRTHAVARNGPKTPSAVPFPSNFQTSKREIVENECRPQSSSRSRTSQSNTWCVAAFRAAAAKARSSKCEPPIRPRTCRHNSYCRYLSKAEVSSSFHSRTPPFLR